MADQRVQELIRELRDRYGVRVVPEPSQALLRLLHRHALAPSPFTPEIAPHLQKWLAEFGSRPVRCFKASGGFKCLLEAGHEGLHRAAGVGWGDENKKAETKLRQGERLEIDGELFESALEPCPQCGSPDSIERLQDGSWRPIHHDEGHAGA